MISQKSYGYAESPSINRTAAASEIWSGRRATSNNEARCDKCHRNRAEANRKRRAQRIELAHAFSSIIERASALRIRKFLRIEPVCTVSISPYGQHIISHAPTLGAHNNMNAAVHVVYSLHIASALMLIKSDCIPFGERPSVCARVGASVCVCIL